MKRLIALTLATGLALPATAQQDTESGPSLMERGLRLFMEGLMTEMEPALRDLEDLAEDARPFLEEMQRSLAEVVDDFDAYAAPEVLPNGDIIIRRKTPLDEGVPQTDAPLPEDGNAIDL